MHDKENKNKRFGHNTKEKKQQNNKKLRHNVLFSIAATSAAATGAVLGPGIQPVLAEAIDLTTEILLENIHESEENKINENEHGMKGSGDEAELDKADNDTDAAGHEA